MTGQRWALAGDLDVGRDDAVAEAEGQLGVTLPNDLLHLLRIQNGGVVADAWVEHPAEANSYSEDSVPFDHLFGIGPPGLAGPMTLLDTPYLVGEWDLPAGIVLLSGQGHYWIALDYRTSGRSGEPSVAWVDETDHDLQLAPTFRAFVENLRPESDPGQDGP